MANRSTKNHWNVLSMKLQMSLESHLATDTTVILPQTEWICRRLYGQKMIEAQERQMAGKGENIQ